MPGPKHGADVLQEGSGEGQGSEGSEVTPVLPAHRTGSPFAAVFAGFVWFAVLAPSLQMSGGGERGGRGASVGRCLEKGSEHQGYLGVKVRQVALC